MRLVPVNHEEVKGYKKTKLLELLEEFERMDATAVRVDGANYNKASTGATTIRAAAKRFGKLNIDAVSRNGNIYLLKK